MADESVFDHHDALRLILAGACDYINIKFSKSGGISEALKINQVCESHNIPCMMGWYARKQTCIICVCSFCPGPK